MNIGIISDSHGQNRPQALVALSGSDHILHAGDVGRAEILRELAGIAPVTAIRGNVDTEGVLAALPETATIRLGGIAIHMVHDVKDLADDPAAMGWRLVISGHSHRPGIREENGVLYLNPGAAGPRRFSLPVCVARLVITGGRPTAEIVHLDV